MSTLQNFYTDNEDTIKEESINKYIDIFKECHKNPPQLEEAIKHMFINAGATEDQSNLLIKDIKDKAETTIGKKK